MIDTIKIGGSVFTVSREDCILDAETFKEGYVSFRDHIIKVATGGRCDQVQHMTILHEMLHVLSENYVLCLEEDNVERLANALYAFLIDNKDFIREVINV